MSVTGISDLQMSLIGRRQNAGLRAELVELTQEIASGKVSDVQAAISGDTAPLSSIDRNLSLISGYEFAASRVDLKLSYAATSLENLQGNVSALGAKLLSALQGGSNSIAPVLDSAKDNFKTSVASLQVQIGSQYVFSGLNSERAPLIPAEDILDSLRAATAGVSDPATFLDLIDRWFTEPGNGFDTIAYQGGADSTVGLVVSSTTTVDDMFTANDDEIRSALRDLASITLVSEGSFAGSAEDLEAVIDEVGNNLIASDNQLTALRAALGEQRQRVDEATVQNGSERFALSEARNEILGVDVFEAAGRLEEVQTQLESLYLITARTSRLNLTEYLR